MRAIRQHAFGGPEELRLEEIPDPHPAEGQVRIRVESAGVHLIDTVIRRGQPGGPYPLPDLPMTPGREVAGRIDETGPGVDRALAGRAAVVDLGPASGGYAELAVASAAALHLLPDGLTADDAVAMVGTGRTAIHILDVAAATPRCPQGHRVSRHQRKDHPPPLTIRPGIRSACAEAALAVSAGGEMSDSQ